MSGRLIQWVAPSSIRWYEEGEHCLNPVAGDMIIVNHGTFDARAIEFGEKAMALLTEKELQGFTWCDHVAWIREGKDSLRFVPDDWRHSFGAPANVPKFIVSELGPRGHEYRTLFDYVDRLYCVVHFDVPELSRQRVLDNDDCCATIKYGWLEYPSLIVDGATGAHFLGGYGNTMICSTEVTLCGSGLYWFADRQASGMTPAHNALMVGARH